METKLGKGSVFVFIDPEIKKQFNEQCLRLGSDILPTTVTVIELAFKKFCEGNDIKSIKEQLEANKDTEVK